MREYSKYSESSVVQENLSLIASENTSVQVYKSALHQLGKELGKVVKRTIDQKDKIVLACSNEDADWLSEGIIEELDGYSLNLAVFWNLRMSIPNTNQTVAPILKSYIEKLDQCDILVISKSIIYTSCVVRTNLNFLIEKIDPKRICIVAPVIYKDAEESLRKEFSKDVGSKFEFYYFAKDEEINAQGNVIPGIGGSIYNRLGIGEATSKNSYIPILVKKRRELNYI